MKKEIRKGSRSTLPVARRTHPRIGLALGGGGARGLAHILMLEVLDELGIRPACIAGTSIGAIFGAAYASGLSAKAIRAHTEEALSQKFDLARQLLSARADPIQRLFNLLPLRNALLKPETLLDLVLPSHVPADFSALQIPLEVVATDFYGQEATVIGSGPLRRAVAASIALPVIFQPVVMDGRALLDGGLANPLPFDLVGQKCDITIAIDVSGSMLADRSSGEMPSAFESVIASIQILQRSIVREKLKAMQPDIYIDVGVDDFHVLEFHRFRDILAAAQSAKESLHRQLTRVLDAEPAPIAATAAAEAAPPAIGDAKAGKRRLGLQLSRRRT